MGVPSGNVGSQGVGVCLAHLIPIPITVTIIQGVPTVLAMGAPVATIGSIGICSCGHTSVALSGASTVLATGIGVHRVGDMGLPPAGNYTLTTGAATVLSGA